VVAAAVRFRRGHRAVPAIPSVITFRFQNDPEAVSWRKCFGRTKNLAGRNKPAS